MCPGHTYIVSDKNNLKVSGDMVNTNMASVHDTDYDDREKRTLDGRNGATGDGTQLVTDHVSLSCLPCDKSCFSCFGPLNSDCISCFAGSQLRTMKHTNESYCINFAERSSGNAVINQPNRYSNSILFLIFLVPSVIVIILVIILTKHEKIKCTVFTCRENDNKSSSSYTYDRVALIADDE